MEMKENIEKELLETVKRFFLIEDIEKFEDLSSMSFVDFTGGKYFDDLDPKDRSEYVYNYNLMNGFLKNLADIQKQWRATWPSAAHQLSE